MNPLLIPTLLIALVLFAVGAESARRCCSRKSRVGLSILWFVLGMPGFAMGLYYLHGFDDAAWFYTFRSLPLIELSAAGAGLFAGALSEWTKGSTLFSKPMLLFLLCLGVTGPHLKPILSPLAKDQFTDQWKDGVCLQSTPSSCGAASAATIFRTFGENLTEQEIAEECLTYEGGTEIWYVARAFCARGRTMNFRIEQGFPADLKAPAIAGVRVGNVGHFIAILEIADGHVITGDPLTGRAVIPTARVNEQFNFTGFFMEIH